MPYLYDRYMSKEELLKHVGDVSQVGGIRRVRLQDGPEDQVSVLEFRTGGGFDFDVIPSRGFDIGAASFRGTPLAWRSGLRERHPAYFEAAGAGWLRSFGGGLLVTCGLTQVGSACEDGGENLPIHGRISSTPAYDVCIRQDWLGDDYMMEASGRLREASVFGENLELERRVITRLGVSSLNIKDRVTNHGWTSCPHMLLYHINLGFPLVDEGSTISARASSTVARDADAREDQHRWFTMEAPDPSFREKVYFHRIEPDDRGRAQVDLLNPKEPGGVIGMRLEYDSGQLPLFIEWKMNGAGTYVCGLEPANCLVMGRAHEREAGSLKMLEPGQTSSYNIYLEVLHEQDYDQQKAGAADERP